MLNDGDDDREADDEHHPEPAVPEEQRGEIDVKDEQRGDARGTAAVTKARGAGRAHTERPTRAGKGIERERWSVGSVSLGEIDVSRERASTT